MFQPDAETLTRLLPFPELIQALARAFVTGAEVPPRHVHAIGEGEVAGTSLLMPAWDATGYYGVKIVNVFPGNRAQGLPGLHATYTLFDARTGVPLAMLDGDVITARRTAAASALGASLLARADAARLVVVGAGRVGSLIGPAIAAVRPLTDIAIWSPNARSAAACAAAWQAAGLPTRAVGQLETAVREADIVSCATAAETPVIRGGWLPAGSHLDLVGSFKPSMAEAEPACFAEADVWVDTDEAMQKAGDLLQAIEAGAWRAADLRGDLAELCRGTVPGRADRTQRTIFKAVGTGLEDLAAARLAYHSGHGSTPA